LYSEILADDPSDTASMEGRVRALIAAGSWRSALEEARGFASARPADFSLQAALGEALYRAGRLDEARSVLEPVAAADSPAPRALLALGLVREAEGREEEGNRLLERAVSLVPEDREILFWSAGAAA